MHRTLAVYGSKVHFFVHTCGHIIAIWNLLGYFPTRKTPVRVAFSQGADFVEFSTSEVIFARKACFAYDSNTDNKALSDPR